jgi:hypothetical protein
LSLVVLCIHSLKLQKAAYVKSFPTTIYKFLLEKEEKV